VTVSYISGGSHLYCESVLLMVAVSYIVTVSFIGGGSQLYCDSQFYWWW
jgi:hypothetical protein